jgi:S-disulfanyl-L-cysteine oxidoreductase SoxD
MPWTAPKSLSVDEVYAVTAYLLNMGGVLPDDFVMSDRNIAEVQARMPNRNGMTTSHGLWPGKGMGNERPDVKVAACMKNCATEPKLASFLPDFARNAHGNLAEQNRAFGAQRGANTDQPPPATRAAAAVAAAAVTNAPAAPAAGADAVAALTRNGCTACHGLDSKIVGPAFSEVARKYSSRADAATYLAGRIKGGGQGVWGAIPMPAQALPESEARMLAEWLAKGAPR